MSSEDLHAFLDRLELGHHLDRLVGEEVCSVNRLRTLSEAHLEKIGLKIGARTAILHELEKSKPSPVEQIATVQPEIVPSSVPCADDDEQDMALVLPFESSIVLPTAPLVVQEFYRSFLQEKQNNVLRLGVGGYEQSGGDLAFFDYAWNFWGETGELFLFYKRYFLSTFSRDDYEKNGGDAAVRVYLRQNFRQLCFDNLAHFAQASGAPGAGSIPGGSDEVSQTAVSIMDVEGNQPPSPASKEGSTIALRSPLRIPYCEISVKVFKPDEFSQATTALRKNTVSKLRVAWCNKYAFEQMLRESFFASLMLNDSLVCLDLGSEHCGNYFDSYHFRYLLDVFESRKAKPLPLRMLKLAGQPLTKAGSSWSLLCASKQERPSESESVSRLCSMLREGVCQLSHLDVSSTGLSEESVLELLRVRGESGHLVHLNVSNNVTSKGNIKLQALVLHVLDTNAAWEVQKSQKEEDGLQPLFQLLNCAVPLHGPSAGGGAIEA